MRSMIATRAHHRYKDQVLEGWLCSPKGLPKYVPPKRIRLVNLATSPLVPRRSGAMDRYENFHYFQTQQGQINFKTVQVAQETTAVKFAMYQKLGKNTIIADTLAELKKSESKEQFSYQIWLSNKAMGNAHHQFDSVNLKRNHRILASKTS